jgi:hypothetical protein
MWFSLQLHADEGYIGASAHVALAYPMVCQPTL